MINNIRSLSFEITQRCNLKCSYCYLEDRHGANLDMSFDVAERAVRFFFDEISNNQGEFDVVFIGGEPLMNFEVIVFIVNAIKKYKLNNRKIYYTIITNGTLLDDEKLRFIEKENIRLQISVDGDANAQYQCRKTKGNENSYFLIKKGIDKAKEYNIHLVLRGTYTKKTIPITNLLKHFYDLNVPQFSFMPVSYSSTLAKELILTPQEIKEQVYLQIKDFEERLVANKTVHDIIVIDHLLKLVLGVKNNYPCGAFNEFLGVGADGCIYPCHRYYNSKKSIIGDVWSGINHSKREKFKEYKVDDNKYCKKCAFKYMCGGPCPYVIQHNEKGSLIDPILCNYYNEFYRGLFGLIIRLRKSNQAIKYLNEIIGLNINNDTHIAQNHLFSSNLCVEIEPGFPKLYCKKNAVVIDIDDGGILYNKDNLERIFICNNTAMIIWDLIDSQNTSHEIVQRIADVCEVSTTEIEKDIYQQLATFQELGFIEEVKETA